MLTILLFAMFALLLQGAGAGTVSFDLPMVASLAAYIALPVKFGVDVVKGAWTSLPGKLLPLVGLILGYAFCFVVLVASSTKITGAVAAQCVLAAVGAQLGAMAATGAQNTANDARDKAGNG